MSDPDQVLSERLYSDTDLRSLNPDHVKVEEGGVMSCHARKVPVFSP